ncbi:MAG: hypothetical protein F9K38_04470 [Pseudorhodoplanes sp.]|nr:MAG: hypothetical protein F9K38_04470 [Pseudorhodoplanes sp.]
MTTEKNGGKEETRRAAEADLRRLREADAELGGSLPARRAAAHFAGRDAGETDAIEIWGRRIGRSLSAVAFAALSYYLYITYIR